MKSPFCYEHCRFFPPTLPPSFPPPPSFRHLVMVNCLPSSPTTAGLFPILTFRADHVLALDSSIKIRLFNRCYQCAGGKPTYVLPRQEFHFTVFACRTLLMSVWLTLDPCRPFQIVPQRTLPAVQALSYDSGTKHTVAMGANRVWLHRRTVSYVRWE